jgi:hypothetical protein
MQLDIRTPATSLSKAYAKQTVKQDDLERFRTNLAALLDHLRSNEDEEHLKNFVRDFLKDTWYQQTNLVNTSDKIDLAIYGGRSSADPVAVIIETKAPANRNEMMTVERPNTKAFHEVVLYYLRQVIEEGNHEIKHLIVTNTHEWFIFDGVWFERNVRRNPRLVKAYRGLKPEGHDNRHFYEDVLRPWLEGLKEPIPCCRFDLREYGKVIRTPVEQESRKLIELYKLLSPQHLLKQPFVNDSNALNREFYNELLHILGLEEIKEKGKKHIRRASGERRNEGSLLENTINKLMVQRTVESLENPAEYGKGDDERFFSITLELCITWLNRILFLKLLEGRLIVWNRGDLGHAFLNSDRIRDFDDLQELFFEVLARRPQDRTPSVAARFANIPYLNSSLFEISDLERKAIQVSGLDNRSEMRLYGTTVLKNSVGKRRDGSMNTLRYLLAFLDAYDFASEGKDAVRETPKTIINASVLGLIFEKINGYRDGSFYTPGFITMYMSGATIRRSVVEKFRTANLPGLKDLTDFDDLCERMDYNSREVRRKANELINSLRICDPSVGSGHFLVSALNEIIAIKGEMHILEDRDGKLLRCRVAVDNDELVVMFDDDLFSYNFKDDYSRKIQEALFHEKAAIIERCLFGVDINPKSVAICRLRLWIELLKNAYYTKESSYSELETLPNIDINIKCGNSLISRFALGDDKETLSRYAPAQRQKLKNLTARYKEKVWAYKLGSDGPSNKAILRREIERIKDDWRSFSNPADWYMQELARVKNELAQEIFVFDNTGMNRHQELNRKAEELERKIEERQRTIYANAFEWRFEFPEVLDEDGNFTGFDVVIGNPPYIRHESIKEQKPVLEEMFGNFFCGTADIYTYFYKIGLNVAKPGAILCFIAPNKFMRAGYGKNTRVLLTTQAWPLMVLDFGDLPIFDEATTYPSIVMVEKRPAVETNGGGPKMNTTSAPTPDHHFIAATFTDPDQLSRFDEVLPSVSFSMPVSALRFEGWTLERPDVLELMAKLRKVGKPLGEYVGEKFYYGIKTGLNEAFVIDEETKTRLIAEDPKSAELIKPWLRGRDIRKWQVEWARLYIITIASSSNKEWPWSQEKSEPAARQLFAQEYPAVYKHLSQWEAGLVKRDDKGKFWWELRACVYWEEFNKTKLVYQEIATFQSFAYAETGQVCNNKCFLIPEKNDFFLALLNSKLFWWYLGNLTSGLVGGARAMQMPYMNQLPIPTATDEQKTSIIERVEKILEVPDSPDVLLLEAEIDRLVYELYGLTEEEISVVNGSKDTARLIVS